MTEDYLKNGLGLGQGYAIVAQSGANRIVQQINKMGHRLGSREMDMIAEFAIDFAKRAVRIETKK